MARASGTASRGAVITSSWPGRRFSPTRTATSARRSRRSAKGRSAGFRVIGAVMGPNLAYRADLTHEIRSKIGARPAVSSGARPGDLAEILPEGEAHQVIGDHVLQAGEAGRIRRDDAHQKSIRLRLEGADPILAERHRTVLRRALDRELVAPVAAELLQVAAGLGGLDAGL